MSERKVLLSTEVPQWAWGHMFRGIAKYAPTDFPVEVCDSSRLNKIIYDRNKAVQYKACCQSSWMESITGKEGKRIKWFTMSTLIASHGCEYPFPPEDVTSIPAKIATRIRNVKQAEKKLRYFDSLLCVSNRLHKALSPTYRTAKRVIPGVDHHVFCPRDRRSDKSPLVVGWCGQSLGVTKGYEEVLRPLMDRLGDRFEWKILTRTHENALTQEEMVEWYHGIDVLLSTSCSEGFQMPTLEAAACGKPVIMTRCGGADELASGWLKVFLVDNYKYKNECERVIEDIIAILISLDRDNAIEAGKWFRQMIEEKFSWAVQSRAWLEAMCGQETR
jgi:hypothetical protein